MRTKELKGNLESWKREKRRIIRKVQEGNRFLEWR